METPGITANVMDPREVEVLYSTAEVSSLTLHRSSRSLPYNNSSLVLWPFFAPSKLKEEQPPLGLLCA